MKKVLVSLQPHVDAHGNLFATHKKKIYTLENYNYVIKSQNDDISHIYKMTSQNYDSQFQLLLL